MKQLRIIALALTTALSLVLVPSASATTLEVNGVKQSGPVTIHAVSIVLIIKDTFGLSANRCASTIEGTISTTTGAKVEGPISTLTFKPCENEELIVHKKGSLSIEWISGTTNGTLRWIGVEWTTPSPFGLLRCITASSPGTDIGTVTGVASGVATIHINATLECGISAKWTGTYTATSPEGLGVTDGVTPGSTTLEIGGTPENEAVEIAASLKAGTSLSLRDTFGLSANKCTGSTIEAKTVSPFSGTRVAAPVTSLTFKACENEEVIVHNAGSLSVERIGTTTNGTVRSIGAVWTFPSPFGLLTCTTASGIGTDIGTLTGVASGTATIDINATLNCGSISARLTGTYTVTSPEGLGVTA